MGSLPTSRLSDRLQDHLRHWRAALMLGAGRLLNDEFLKLAGRCQLIESRRRPRLALREARIRLRR
jgi:hypothetical protein